MSPQWTQSGTNGNDYDDDEEQVSMGRQTLPVARLRDDFNGIPQDGMEYLFTVRYRHVYIFSFETRGSNSPLFCYLSLVLRV